jgi:hypothetical protein
MSEQLLSLARGFVAGVTHPTDFADKYIDVWKAERDSGRLLEDSPALSAALSSIFCLADLYNPADDRESYEFDENQLRGEIERVLKDASLH